MYTIPERDAAFLLTLTSVGSIEELPAAVVEEYWAYKQIINRTRTGPLTEETLAMVVRLAGFTKRLPIDQKLEFAPELYQQGKLKVGDPVNVLWRKKTVPATFLGITGGKDVKLDINGTEQTVKAETVTIPPVAA